MRTSFYTAILVFTALFSQSFGFSTQEPGAAEKLRSSLDSLELKIQEQRRQGEDIEDLLIELDSLKAAVESVNLSSGGDSEFADSAGEDLLKKKEKTKLHMPTSLIDWMIVFVGAVAAAAALLLASLQILLRMKRKKMMRRAEQQSVPVKSAPVKLPVITADTVQESTEPVPSLSAYTRKGMKTVPEPVQESIQPAAKPVVQPEETVREDLDFVKNMLADLAAKKAAAEAAAPVQKIQPEVQPEITELISEPLVPESAVPDDLYDGLEDIMAELESELLPSWDEPEPEMSIDSEPAIVQEEPVKARVLTPRESILELADAGLTPTEIGRKLSMSIGEVQLVLTMARRSS